MSAQLRGEEEEEREKNMTSLLMKEDEDKNSREARLVQQDLLLDSLLRGL